jgi:AmiR/NasT family two-component response regulator
MEVTRRRGRRRKKLLDDLNPLNAELNPICHLLALIGGATTVVVRRLRVKDRRGYSHLKEEALDRTLWMNRFGGGFGPVVRQTIE